MDMGGYTNLPDTLPEAQQLIVKLSDDLKAMDKTSGEMLTNLDKAVAMIEAARLALNAIERVDI